VEYDERGWHMLRTGTTDVFGSEIKGHWPLRGSITGKTEVNGSTDVSRP
jgi:hypothetical protein